MDVLIPLNLFRPLLTVVQALDRFAGFFIEPLLTRDCTEREINAALSPKELA